MKYLTLTMVCYALHYTVREGKKKIDQKSVDFSSDNKSSFEIKIFLGLNNFYSAWIIKIHCFD